MRSVYRRTAVIVTATALVGAIGVGTAAATPRAATSASTALVVRGYLQTRLVLTVTPGRTLTVAGTLTRAATAAPATRRPVKIYVRIADTGRWRLAATLVTSSAGHISYRLADSPLLQITLRFEGD